MEAAVVLFNRDLRLSDHPALDAAVTTAKRIVPLFVLDDTILQRAAPNRVQFLLDCLHDFRAALRDRGGDLIVRTGDPVTEAMGVARAPLRPVRSWRAPTSARSRSAGGRARPSLRSRGHCARAPSRDHDRPTRRALSLRRRSLPHLHALLRRWSETPWRETARRRTTSRCPRSSQRTEARFPRSRSWSVGRARPTSQVAGSAAHRTGSTPGSTRLSPYLRLSLASRGGETGPRQRVGGCRRLRASALLAGLLPSGRCGLPGGGTTGSRPREWATTPVRAAC
jgi:hypothetical protein